MEGGYSHQFFFPQIPRDTWVYVSLLALCVIVYSLSFTVTEVDFTPANIHDSVYKAREGKNMGRLQNATPPKVLMMNFKSS